MTYRRRATRQRHRKTPLLRIVTVSVITLGLVGAAGAGIAINNSKKDRPNLDEVKVRALGENSRIFDRENTLLARISSQSNRTAVRYGEIPDDLRNGTIAIEDKRFWNHNGVDWNRFFSAAIKNAREGSLRQGGSTITMQVAKNLYSDRGAITRRTFEQKLRETSLALQIEDRFTKEQILTRYLNGISYGGNAIGVEAAALTYFRKHVKELNLAQSALLAGMPQAPSSYNPFTKRDAARARRNEVLDQMLSQGYITKEQAQSAKVSGLQLKRGTAYTETKQPYFVNYVRKQLEGRYGKRRTLQGGFRVFTTIDPQMQTWAEDAIKNILNQPDDPEAAIVLMDVNNGYIRAMASKRPYGKASQYNYAADAKRQPGSTFKTFVLTEAVRQGINPSTTIYPSSSLKFVDDEYGKIDVKAFGKGPMSIYQGTLASNNAVYTLLGLDVGPENVATMAQRMGISEKLKAYASLALGAQEVTPLDMAVAYSPLANGGYQIVPTAVRDIEGQGISRNPFIRKRRPILSDGITYEVTRILRANIQGGTGRRADIGYPAAGKTGTTEDNTDAWFVGYTPHYVAAVWIGYPNNNGVKRTLSGLRGGAFGGDNPARIWHDLMIKVAALDGQLEFKAPNEPVEWQPSFVSKFTRLAQAQAAAAASSAAAESAKSASTAKTGTGGGLDEPPLPADADAGSAPAKTTIPVTPAPVTTPPVTEIPPAAPAAAPVVTVVTPPPPPPPPEAGIVNP